MISSLRQGLFNAAQAIGYTIVPNWRAERHPQATYLRKLFRSFDIDCVIDVGANLGQYHDFLRDEVEFKGEVISFEPIPSLAAELERRAKSDRHWTVHQCALGAAGGTALLNVMSSTTFSSFLKPKHCMQRFRSSNDVREQVAVPVKTLDDFLPDLMNDLGVERPYLKLDTQGFDLEVVRGAPQSMSKICALQTEASVRPIYEGMPTFPTVLEQLEALGFAPSGIFPNNDGHFPLLIEFDFHMINGSLSKDLS
jgi:FkbM family methyltransferase